ncbi:MAG: sigma-54 dependent transcriptional regulator [Candidatus Omnitrophota bacterium]
MHSKQHIHVLVVDDEPLIRRSLSEFLTLEGYAVSSASNGKESLNILKKNKADIILSDIQMPDMNGMQLLKEIKARKYLAPVILMTGYGTIDDAVTAIQMGAYDYITKPIIDNEIKILLERIVNEKNILDENLRLKEELSASRRDFFHGIVGADEKMRKIYTLIEAISNTRATVLIRGESGTGKRLIAHAIHKCSELEKGKPFVEVSCGALTETLLESELFGHVKGAFTGAIKDKPGRFELADGGTIFLDEIDAFSPALQVKLLRVLQEGEFERVGDNNTIKVDVRVITATNQNLENLITQNKFRKDLYYRLNIITIEIPPLRERRGDIPLLVDELIKRHAKQINKTITGTSKEAMAILTNCDWPGNIRELENVIERAIILCKNKVITPTDFPDALNKKVCSAINIPDNHGSEPSCKLKKALQEPERDLLVKSLESANWNRNKTAKSLGINRTTLYKKMLRFGLLKNNSKKGK